ncbi:zinc finger protein 699-like [Lucilia cuprina]|uniref:zinc finger protein 699-like n=1 Tax=Lucilia cuprina TaxID=7375 RepID=UPI001F06DFF5|nr:zinc finger protein 699-like [Lucilia cuprina]
MRNCCLCHKNVDPENGLLFNIPKDERRRKKWSEICRIQFSTNSRICADHFSPSDIIKVLNKCSLTSNAVPFVQHRNLEIMAEDENNKTNENCRCCSNPSKHFIQLDDYTKTNEGKDKSYRDVLYEIIQLSLTTYQEINMPQQICEKCAAQLETCYKFIQQACKVSRQYLDIVEQQTTQEDIKNIEHLQESLIEISETTSAEEIHEELKVEPLNIECNLDIKEENEESENLLPMFVDHNEESHEERDLLPNSNSDEHSSEDDDDESDEPESLNDNNEDLNDETLARSCDICHKIYRNEKFLKIHKRYTHMPEEDKLPCPLCAYKASRSSALKVHMGLVHGQDKVEEYFKPVLDSGKKYPCSLCPRSYGRKDSLRKHVRRKHNSKPAKEEKTSHKKPKPKDKERFLCTYCGQSYSSKCGLESHILTHTGERPFSCEICSKTFKRLKDLQLHRVIHSDEKPHQCSECGKAFKRVDKLKIHMRVHSELRPYKCQECEKTFKYPSVLRTHMHIHTGQTPFSCKTCGEAFSLRTSLNNHCLKNGHVK